MNTPPNATQQAIRLMIGGKAFGQAELDSAQHAAELQQAMEHARHKYGHALCLCRRQPLKLQVRRRDEKFHLAVWPNEGPQHDSECAFFRDELLGAATASAGLSQIEPPKAHIASAPARPASVPNILRAKQTAAPADKAPAAAQAQGNEAPSPSQAPVVRRDITLSVPGLRAPEFNGQRVINLKTLAMGLWEEAQLCRWHPSWRRDWGRARYQLQQVAATMSVNGQPLEELLFAPRPFRESAREQVNTEWNGFVDSLNRRGGANAGLRLLVAPVRSLAVPPNRPPVMHLRHLRHPIGLSDAALEFVRNDCRAPIRQLQANDNQDRLERALAGRPAAPVQDRRHPEVMGFFIVEGSSRGAVFARAAWLMNVHPRSFIPANSPNTVMLVDALLERGHAFQRVLADVQPMKKTAPDWLVRHVIGPDGKPVARAALDVLDRGSSPEYLQVRQDMARALATKGVPTWYWVPSGAWAERRVPPLPPTDEQASHEAKQILQDISNSADCDFQYGHSPRFSP